MTYLQIAREQCCNFNSDGTCEGLDFDNHGKHFRFRKSGERCLLAERGCRCSFFETAAMPMDRSALSPLKRQEWEDALKQYRKDGNVAKEGKRICPKCNERELERRMRLCYICKAQARAESKRKARGV